MAMNQLAECVLEPSSEEPGLFAAYVTALSRLNIAANAAEEDMAFLQFTLDVLTELGFGASSLHCERCGAALDENVHFSMRDNAFHCSLCATTETDVLLSPQLVRFLRTGEGTIDGRRTLTGIALTLRLLRSAAGRLAITQAFERFAQNAATLFHIDAREEPKESCHEL
jgi:recombinational DNA repair protein (RecF pathway)